MTEVRSVCRHLWFDALVAACQLGDGPHPQDIGGGEVGINLATKQIGMVTWRTWAEVERGVGREWAPCEAMSEHELGCKAKSAFLESLGRAALDGRDCAAAIAAAATNLALLAVLEPLDLPRNPDGTFHPRVAAYMREVRARLGSRRPSGAKRAPRVKGSSYLARLPRSAAAAMGGAL